MGMAERTQLKGFTIFVVLMTGVIYPLICYWTWSGEGWLNYPDPDNAGKAITSWGGVAFQDFAGSAVIHMVGGFAALCGALIVGPRVGRWDKVVTEEEYVPHNIPYCVLGTLLLWTGWYGFNPGSTGSMHDAKTAETAGLTVVNTTLAPCVCGLVVFTLRARVVQPRRFDAAGFCNGILAGLVSITASCAIVRPWEAMIIGLVAAPLYTGASVLMVRLKIDDVVDAVSVHGVGGIWGTLALGIFGDGNLLKGNAAQFWTQLVTVLVLLAYVVLTSLLVFYPLKRLGMLRMADAIQACGADHKEHSPSTAYTDEV